MFIIPINSQLIKIANKRIEVKLAQHMMCVM